MNEKNKINKNIILFLAFAFGISWLSGLIIFLTGGIVDSPEIVPGTGITLALILMASVYMWGPALANIITRWVTREGWHDVYLKPSFKQSWLWMLIGWFGPAVLTILGSIIFFLMFPYYFDSGMEIVKSQLGQTVEMQNLTQLVIMQTLVAALISPLLNLISTFGEEFGWRAYLLPKLVPFGTRRALMLSSIIWGLWHWPAVLMGHNYGLDYWGYPWSGLVATIWVMFSIGVFIGWLALKARSVWPAVFAHGALNGMAAIGMLFLSRQAPMLLGPTPAGIIGLLPFTIITILILRNPGVDQEYLPEGDQELIEIV